MPVSEFCEKYGADINEVVNAEEIKAKSAVVSASTPMAATGTKRGRREIVDAREGLNAGMLLQALEGREKQDQLAFVEQMQSQINAFLSQLHTGNAPK